MLLIRLRGLGASLVKEDDADADATSQVGQTIAELADEGDRFLRYWWEHREQRGAPQDDLEETNKPRTAAERLNRLLKNPLIKPQ